MNSTNQVWRVLIKSLLRYPDYQVSPRGIGVNELIGSGYTVSMPSYLNLTTRKVNKRFMFAEAWWILSGSNRLDDLLPYMRVYSQFSDDQVFLRGAYGPKVVEQLHYVVSSLLLDPDTRQAVMTTWRENPAPSVDIPCTLSLQFIIRNNQLNLIVNMRSHDVVKGFTYDVFTFSMIATAVLLLLRQRDEEVSPGLSLGYLRVTAGSLHLYETDFDSVPVWTTSTAEDESITEAVNRIVRAKTYLQLIENLKKEADRDLRN